MASQLLALPLNAGYRSLSRGYHGHLLNAGNVGLSKPTQPWTKGVHVLTSSKHHARIPSCWGSSESMTVISDDSPSSGSTNDVSTWSEQFSSFTKVVVAFFVTWLLCTGVALAATSESIGASKLGLRIAAFLRKSGWCDEAIVFILATLPVLELRGAIPVGYWMQLDPLKIYLLSIAGNMVPVPLILLYLDKLSTFLTQRSPAAKKLLDSLYQNTRNKAGPIQEFKWLGLMLFVAVPFPGTGAWTGAFASVILGMPFWSSFFANFFGVVIAGILVNLLVSLGITSALLVGIALFAASTFMWSFLRVFQKRKG